MSQTHAGWWTAGCLLAWVSGCAHTAGSTATTQAPSGQARVMLVRPGGSTEADLGAGGVSGPNLQLTNTGSGLRGHAYERTVDLIWEAEPGGTKVSGFLGSAPVSLHVTPSEDGWQTQGLFGGSLGQLKVGAQGVSGRVGRCSYDLRAAGPSRFEGQSACPGQPAPTSLSLPDALGALPVPEQAAVLSLLLAR